MYTYFLLVSRSPPDILGRANRVENYARSVCEDTCPTLAELREAVTTLEDTKRIAQRVLGGAHPLTMDIEDELRDAQDALYARGLP